MSSDNKKLTTLAPLLSDQAKSVRLETIKAYLNLPKKDLSFSTSVAVNKVMKEYQQSLTDKADFPENQMVMGGFALTKRDIPNAISAFKRAVEMDPQLVQAWIMLARIQAAVGQSAEAMQTLSTAIKANPDNEVLLQINANQ